MKKYYLHNGTESSGPFDIEALKIQKITKNTPVWFEGMEGWKTAGEIKELAIIFTIIPPPIETFSTMSSISPTENAEENIEETKILGLSKNTFFALCGALLILLGITVLNYIQNQRSEELKIRNHKTEIENYQLELQQKELDEQKIQAVIQEKIDSERLIREKKGNLNSRILEINQQLINYQNNVDAAEEKLKEASGFKLFRSQSDKKEEMDLLQKNIKSFKNDMYQLRNESDRLKLELEKTPN